ncbi:MAG: hypothetical protein M3P28_05185 [Thermoproteota archaeon]|nr:hypothetical protein [Thermoproteota archaeon]
MKVHSFSISSLGKLSISYSKPITEQIECASIVGLDRNLSNVTIGNIDKTTRYDLQKCNEIIDNTKSIYKSFNRNDHRIRKKIFAKYGNRRKNRVNQILHKVSKNIVNELKENKQGIAFEKLTFIRRLYQKGKGGGRRHRDELKKMIGYRGNSALYRWLRDNKFPEGFQVLCMNCNWVKGYFKYCPHKDLDKHNEYLNLLKENPI